jgi:hypothetical protein
MVSLMSGLEGVAAAGAAKVGGEIIKAGSDAAKNSRDIRKATQEALVEAAKDTPGFKQAAEIRGRKTAIREQWGLVIMKPLAGIMGISRDYFNTDFSKDFGQKIADIPKENLQTPKASIAGPVMEGLGYSLDEPELKDLYLELLAAASDDRRAASAHPSFVQTIRQLTAEEARYLQNLLTVGADEVPVARLRRVNLPSNTFAEIFPLVVDLQGDGKPVYDSNYRAYVDNWTRLGLVTVNFSEQLMTPGTYDWIEDRPETADAREAIANADPAEVGVNGTTSLDLRIDQGVITVTSYGALFGQAVGILSS